MDVAPVLFNIAAAARFLSVSQDTIRRLIKKGDVPHARIGSSIRLFKADLEQYLESCVKEKWEPAPGRGPAKKAPQSL